MAQNAPRLCPRCGTPAAPNQRFCAECGTVLDAEVNRPSGRAGEGQQTHLAPHLQPNTEPSAPTLQIQSTSMPTFISTPYDTDQSYPTLPEGQAYGQTVNNHDIPPPPPPIYQPSRTPTPQPYIPPAPTIASPPAYAKKPKRSRGCLIFSLVLLLAIAAGSPRPGRPLAPTNNATSEQLDLQFTYAGVDYTITSVQYAQSYPDDSNITAGGVRLSLNEDNTTAQGGTFVYSDAARLIVPGGGTIAPANEKQNGSPQAQTNDTNWLDFQLALQPADLSQLVLQMGTAQESQMQIPLSPGADLSKYQAKTVTPNTPFQPNRRPRGACPRPGRQATTGNVYVSVALKIFNPTQAPYSAYYGDYARLQAGTTTSSPTADTTFPTSVDSQATANGTLIFMASQGTTSYTLLMLGFPTNPPVKAAKVDFMIQ